MEIDVRPMTNPEVDVVIPVFNGQDYILQALRSVEGQTLRPRSIIVVNDGSTDGTEGIILAFREKCTCNIEYVKRPNCGVNAARNAGIERAKGQYVAFLDADDEWLPNKLEEQAKVLQRSEFKNVGVVYCRYSVMDEAGNSKASYCVFDPKMRGRIFHDLLKRNMIAGSGSAVLARRDCFERVGNFDENLRGAEDWDMWLRLAETFEFDYADEVLVKIRQHRSSVQRQSVSFFVKRLAFYNKWSERLPAGHPVFRGWEQVLVGMILKGGPAKLIRLCNQHLGSKARHALFASSNGSVARSVFFNAPNLLFRAVLRRMGMGSRNP